MYLEHKLEYMKKHELDYKSIIDENNRLYLSWFETEKEWEYNVDDNFVKNSFKNSILSNLKLFHNSAYYNANSFILFSWIPIKLLKVQKWVIYSDKFPYFWKLLFDAFLEKLWEMEKSNVSKKTIDEYLYYFREIFITTNISLYDKDDNFIYDVDWSIMWVNQGWLWLIPKPNKNNLFNYLDAESQLDVIDKLSVDVNTYYNIARELRNEFMLLIWQYNNQDMDNMFNYYSSLWDLSLAKYIWHLISFTNQVQFENTNTKLLYIVDKLKLSENIFIQYLWERLEISINWSKDSTFISSLNSSYLDDEEVSSNVSFSDSVIIPFRASSDYVCWINTSSFLHWYWNYKDKYQNFDHDKYINFNILVFVNNIKNWEDYTDLLKRFLSEISYCCKKSTKDLTFSSIENYLWKENTEIIVNIYNWDNNKDNLDKLFKNIYNGEFNLDVYDREVLELKNIEDIIDYEVNWNPFNNFDSKDLWELLKLLHWTELLNLINISLWVDLKRLTMQTQVHLLHFLWNQWIEKFNTFKLSLQSIPNEADKYSFLNTFLACSEDLSMWDKIIELSKKPESKEIFESYSELVNLQSEINTNNVDLWILLKIILKRWKKLLETWKLSKDVSSKFIKSWLLIKSLYKWDKNWEIIWLREFNEAETWYTLEIVKGWDLLDKTDSLSMMNENNFKFNEKLSKDDFEFIISSIKEAHTYYDPNFINFATNYMPKDFNNPNSNFIFLRDENKKLVWVCKIEIKEDGSNYYWTHYLKEELKWDFSLWVIIQKILEKELSINWELKWYTILWNNEAIIRQIEFSWWIWNEIKSYKLWNYKSKPFLWFLLNSTINYKTKNKDLKTIYDFKPLDSDKIAIEKFSNISDDDFSFYCNNVFKKWYSLTRIIKENWYFLTIFEKID